MFIRRNPALPPIVRGGIAEIHAHLLCRAAVEYVIKAANDDATRLCALHQLDLATTSELLALCYGRAETAAAAWARHLSDLPLAPIGSGRRQANDHGGRIASHVDEMAERLTDPAWETRLRAEDRLWRLAHPIVVRVIHALRRLVSDADSLCGAKAAAYTHCVPSVREALAALEPCDHDGSRRRLGEWRRCGPVCSSWRWCEALPDVVTEESVTISFSCGTRFVVAIPHDGTEVAEARAHGCVPAAPEADADGAPLAEWERELART